MQSMFPVNASCARSSLPCVRMHNNAPPKPSAMPITFISVAFSCRKKTDIRKTQMGCMELKMALETGVVLLMPSR